eukprot:CAMPEP_0185904370 /NCGR_PEP_ID=MMETSP0196C-20130402/3685_1 /TAXON_ID=2932 /ORGANISM="Alexandrium fundyense, Strain CCMP1719" /LENGTH=47 /DNA_ID= /DNA_START= /DNA_END= /DNA_ORIENTATION=
MAWCDSAVQYLPLGQRALAKLCRLGACSDHQVDGGGILLLNLLEWPR